MGIKVTSQRVDFFKPFVHFPPSQLTCFTNFDARCKAKTENEGEIGDKTQFCCAMLQEITVKIEYLPSF